MLFFALAAGMTAASAMVGIWKRDELRTMGGPLKVEVRNLSTERIVADIFVGETPAGLQMDPGEGGFVRFNPKEEGPVLVRLYGGNRGGPLLRAIEQGRFVPGEAAHLKFTILNPAQVQVEYLSGEDGGP